MNVILKLYLLLNEVDIFMDFNSRMVGKEKENINIILL